MNVLSIDPGISHLAFSLVVLKEGSDWKDPKNYSIPWLCMVDLSHPTKNGHDDRDDRDGDAREENRTYPDDAWNIESKGDDPDGKYAPMLSQMERLNHFLSTNPNVQIITKMKELWVIPEQQEGARDANVLFTLMRVNFLLGFICRYFREKGVAVRFVPKTYKHGWSFAVALAKEKTKIDSENFALRFLEKKRSKSTSNRNSRHPRGKGTATKAAGKFNEKSALKNNRKRAICAISRCIVAIGGSQQIVKKFCESCKDSTFNHYADGISQGVRFIREMQSKKKENKVCKDVLDPHLRNRARSKFLS